MPLSQVEPLVSYMIYQYRESGKYQAGPATRSTTPRMQGAPAVTFPHAVDTFCSQAHYDDPAAWPLDCLPELSRRAPPALDEVRPIDVPDMLFSILLLVGTTTAGLGYSYARYRAAMRRRAQTASIEVAGDSTALVRADACKAAAV